MTFKLNLVKSTLAAFAIVAFMQSCTDEVPPIDSDELYLRGFVKQFGVPAQDHTWSMASPVTAKVALEPSLNGTATFYTDAPHSPGSCILAKMAIGAGRGNMRFDTDARTSRVYARVERTDGTVTFSGYVPVEDGRVSVELQGSRAGDCPVTAEPLDYKVNRMTDKNLAAMMPYIKEKSLTWEQLLTNLGPEAVDPVDGKVTVSIPKLYSLKNFDYSQRTPEFSNLDIVPIVESYISESGEEKRGIFGNQSDASDLGKDDNVTHYFFKQQILDPDVTMSVREKGEVTMDLMWRTMEGDTYWGYYYYAPEDEAELYADPKKFFEEVPKYVVFRRQSVEPEHSLKGNNSLMEYRYCRNWSSHPDRNNPSNHDGDHVFTDWTNLESDHAKTIHQQIKEFRPAYFRSVRIRLVYFGPGGENTQGSYEFPKGTRIGFFYGSTDSRDKFYLGNAAMNYYLFHYHIHVMNSDFKPIETPDNYSIFAAKYRFDGSNYVGFEEGGGDNDINDIVFRIHNTWPPEKDLTPGDFPTPEPKSWIIACEDLGSTDDYDFNDVVLSVSHISGENQLAIRPLACGGVLESYVYFGGKELSDMLGEIHGMLGVQPTVMAGVGNGTPHIDFSKVATIERDVASDWLMSEHFGDFHIYTLAEDANMSEGQWIEKETEGQSEFKAPQILLLPDDWRWPIERKSITTAYPSFKAWIGKPNDNHDWVNVTEENDRHLYVRRDL